MEPTQVVNENKTVYTIARLHSDMHVYFFLIYFIKRLNIQRLGAWVGKEFKKTIPYERTKREHGQDSHSAVVGVLGGKIGISWGVIRGKGGSVSHRDLVCEKEIWKEGTYGLWSCARARTHARTHTHFV